MKSYREVTRRTTATTAVRWSTILVTLCCSQIEGYRYIQRSVHKTKLYEHSDLTSKLDFMARKEPSHLLLGEKWLGFVP